MFESPESPEHHHHTGHRWVDFTIAGAALLVSVISMTVAILHGRTMEQMADANSRLVEANSWPFVGGLLSRDNDKIVMGIANSGVGPAKVHWVEVDYRGHPMSGVHALMAACCGYGPASPKLNYGFSVADQTVLRAGEQTAIITFERKKDPTLFKPLFYAVLNVQAKTCYCSVFNECFIDYGQSLDPKPVKTCGAPPHTFDPLN